MKVYRIRHKPTGLYYQPIKGRWCENKSNLGESGKVYIAGKPSLDHISTHNCISKSLCNKYNIEWSEDVRDLVNELEVVEYELVEKNKYQSLMLCYTYLESIGPGCRNAYNPYKELINESKD